MQIVDKSVYTNFASEIDMHVTAYKDKKCVENKIRESIINIAKCKAPKGSTVNICWDIEGKYYTETVTI